MKNSNTSTLYTHCELELLYRIFTCLKATKISILYQVWPVYYSVCT